MAGEVGGSKFLQLFQSPAVAPLLWDIPLYFCNSGGEYSANPFAAIMSTRGTGYQTVDNLWVTVAGLTSLIPDYRKSAVRRTGENDAK